MISRKVTIQFIYIFAAILLSQIGLSAQPSADVGKSLFKANCATCHSKNMRSAGTGPALAGFEERWTDYPREDLYSWIRNSQGQIKAGHPRAVELWNEYKPTVMNAFPNLTDDDIESLVLYVNGVADGTYGGAAAAATGGAGGAVVQKADYTWVYWTLFGILLLASYFLFRLVNNLRYLNAVKEGKEYHRRSLWDVLTSKSMISFILFALVLLGGYTVANNAINLGRQQGYQPDQPIKFSHETHAGINKIECEYCHDGARRSKHSVIPAANTCMNCHSAITVGSKYGTAELTKIYASIGFDPSTVKYIPDYESKSNEEISEIFKAWIGKNYMDEEQVETLGTRGERYVEEQWNDIVKSLTNDQKTSVAGPIEWTRVHNLPDHVYFNHAQHVTVGKIECQDCHGAVEEMEVLQQHSPLSMGWCVNCHRETEVQFASNPYYDSYEKYHEELKSGARSKVTVEDIGGLECQKCHY